MRNHIFVLFVFILPSVFTFAQTESAAVSTESLYVSPTNSESSAKARILARQKLLTDKPCIENYPKMMNSIHKQAQKKGRKAFNKTSVFYSDSKFVDQQIIPNPGERDIIHPAHVYTSIYLTNEAESYDAYRQAYKDEYEKLCKKYGVAADCHKQHTDNTNEDLDESMDILRKRNIEPGHISYFYSNQAMITNEKDIEHLLKNITTNNNSSKPLEKYTKNNVVRIYLVVYQWNKGSHVKAFLFTPEGVIFERLYFTNARNAVNPRTGTTVYVTEEEALIFTQG